MPTGTVAMTLVGAGASVAASARAGVAVDSGSGWDSTSALETALTDADLDAIYAGRTRIAQAFSAEPLEATAVQTFSAVHGDGAGEQTVTSSLRLQVSTLDLDAAGDLTFGLFSGDAIGPGFDTMHFSISVGSLDAVTLVEADFSTEARAEAHVRDRVFSFDDLDQYAEFGSLILDVTVTTTGTQANGGFTAGILFADVGGDTATGTDAVFAPAAMPLHLFDHVGVMLV